MEKGAFISDIQPGQGVSGLFCVASKSVRQTRNGVPFISMTVVDSSGSLEARIWDRAREMEAVFEKGDIIHLQAEAVEFNGRCQLKVNNLRPLEQGEEVDPAMFLPVSPIDRKAFWHVCERAIKSIKSPEYRHLLKELFADRKIRIAFCQAPAAKKMHHACIGGLLEHSVNLFRLSEAVCRLYTRLDRDLLVTASLCHDIGKIREFSWQRPPIDYTDQGRLLGHIVMGLQMVEEAAEGAGLNQDSRSLLALKHVILSHHGQKEFGSPVLPMTEEALVFHMMDDLDAKLNFLNGLKRDGEEPVWTDFQRLFDRYFLLGPKIPGAGPGDEQIRERSSGQAEKGKEGKPAQAGLWDNVTKLDMEE